MTTRIQSAVVAAVAKGVTKAAQLESTTTTVDDAPQVTNKVLTELGPIIAHVTDSEPWYQSRVTWGAIASIVIPIAGALGVASDVIDADTLVTVGMAIGSAVGGVLTLYGRWKAKKPLGS